MPYKPNEREYRALASFDYSESADSGELILRGKPILFDTPTVICVIDGVERYEVIAGGALDGCDMSDFILNRNHGLNDSTVFARTRNNSLKYVITDSAFEIEGHLDGEDERHVNLHRDVLKRRVDKMSFSFVTKEDAYDRETHTRTITKIAKLYDVSAVDFAAYGGTDITTRGFFDAEREKEFRSLEQEHRRKLLIAKTLL